MNEELSKLPSPAYFEERDALALLVPRAKVLAALADAMGAAPPAAPGEIVKAIREYLGVHPDITLGGHTLDDMALDLARIALGAGAVPAAVAPQGEYPPLPSPSIMIGYGNFYSAEKLRAYFDLGRQAAPALEAPAAPVAPAPKFDLRTSAGGRGYVAWYFANVLKRHDFHNYIHKTLAADFACALAPALKAPAAPSYRAEMGIAGRDYLQRTLGYDPDLPFAWADLYAAMLAAAPQAPAAPAEAVELDMDRVLALADEHADESREDGVRLLNRGGLLALAKDVLRIFSPEAAPALSTEPLPVMPRAITTGLGIDDSGEEPAYCIMAAFRQEDDARYALSILSAGIEAQAAPAAPAVDAETIHLQDLKNALAECKELRQQLTLMDEQQAGTVWRWQADGQHQLDTMGNRMGVLIYACDLRALLAGAAPAVDAVDAVDALAPVQALLDMHAELLDANPYAYFELAYTRQTGWMAWITDKPMYGAQFINQERKVLARGQGDTPAEACAAAAQAAANGEQHG